MKEDEGVVESGDIIAGNVVVSNVKRIIDKFNQSVSSDSGAQRWNGYTFHIRVLGDD